MSNKQVYTVNTRREMAKQCLKYREIDISDLFRVGDIIIYGIGDENVYFTSVWFGTEHFCKVN
jgi:hypothetical protein